MAEVREMTIPLRAAWSVPRTRRANRAMQNPPRKIRVQVTREEGFPLEVKLLED